MIFGITDISPEILPPVKLSSSKISKSEEDESKPKEENIEGRFFIKDKLCALGLADVSNKSDDYILNACQIIVIVFRDTMPDLEKSLIQLCKSINMSNNSF